MSARTVGIPPQGVVSRWRAIVAIGAAFALVGCGSAGAVACSEFMELTSAERVDQYVGALDDRNLRFTGPRWQLDMQVAVVESFCMQNPSASLSDGLDFAGVPSR